MNETTLNFLTRDGAIAVTFSAALTSVQYDELFLRIPAAESPEELRLLLDELQEKWDLMVLVDAM